MKRTKEEEDRRFARALLGTSMFDNVYQPSPISIGREKPSLLLIVFVIVCVGGVVVTLLR